MAQDVSTVTQQMLREWHKQTFPGLPDAERLLRSWGKWQEESREFQNALEEWDENPCPETTRAVREEAADVLITLMCIAEYAGFNLTREAIAKFNENTNRIFVQDGVDENGFPRWKRVRDMRAESIRNPRKDGLYGI